MSSTHKTNERVQNVEKRNELHTKCSSKLKKKTYLGKKEKNTHTTHIKKSNYYAVLLLARNNSLKTRLEWITPFVHLTDGSHRKIRIKRTYN